VCLKLDTWNFTLSFFYKKLQAGARNTWKNVFVTFDSLVVTTPIRKGLSHMILLDILRLLHVVEFLKFLSVSQAYQEVNNAGN
jgi:hypothetical protein